MNATQLNTLLHCLRQIVNLTQAIKTTTTIPSDTFDEQTAAIQLNLLAKTTTTTDHDHDHDHEHDHEHEHDDDANGLLLAKITAIVVLFLASAFCGSIPFMIERFWKWNNKSKNHNNNNNGDDGLPIIVDPQATTIVKCLLYFGGGVLLCTTFVHLLPEVQETIEQLTECQLLPNFPFPLAEVLMCVGFFLMYLIEEVIHTYIHYAAKRNKVKADNMTNVKASDVALDEADMGVVAFERGHSMRRSCLLNGNKPTSTTETSQEVEKPKAAVVRDEIKTISTHDLMNYDVEQAKYSEHQPTVNHHHHHHSHHHGHSHAHNHHHHHHVVQTKPQSGDKKQSRRDNFSASLRGLFIVLALSIHELFEGMAIGLEHSSASVWVMFGAVSAHKLVLAFCVGVELIVARTKLSLAILYILTFAIVSPLGIGIGIAVSSADVSGSNVVSVYLQGLACGTLLYVVFFEILSKNYAGLKALFALIAGFCIMFGLRMIGEGEHNHSHGSCEPIIDTTTTTTTMAPRVAENHGLEQQLQLLRDASTQLLQLHTKNNA